MSKSKHERIGRRRRLLKDKARISALFPHAPIFRTTPSLGSGLLPTVSLVRATDVAPKPPSYFWPPAIAFGKVAVILAPTPTCTSALIAELVAKASVGGELPQAKGPVPRSDTVVVAAEVAVAERIRPQLEAAGADLNRVDFLGSGAGQAVGLKRFEPAADCTALRAAIRACGTIKLVVVEFTSRRIDADMAQNYMAIFAPFYTIARELDLAVVLLLHPAADPRARNQIARAANTVASFESVGAVGFVTREKTGGRWVLVWAKNIVGHDAPGVAFRIEAKVISSGAPAAVIAWDPEPVAAPETVKLLAVGGESNARPSKLQRAKDFLAAQTNEGPVKAAKLEKRAAAAGINKATLTRARKQLGIGVGSKDELVKSSAVKRAQDFLLAELAGGPVAAKALQRKADKAGISWASIRRARKALKVKSKRKDGVADKGRWVWRLPSSG